MDMLKAKTATFAPSGIFDKRSENGAFLKTILPDPLD
jgi:hypothetical protein